LYSSRYTEIYNECLEGRKVSRNDWNDVFWIYFRHNHPISFKENSTITQASLARNNEQPLEDDDRMVQQVTATNSFNAFLSVDDDELKNVTVV
jgi:hypothetical protein